MVGESLSDMMTSPFCFLCLSVCSVVVIVCYSSGTSKESRAGKDCFQSPSSTLSQTDATFRFAPLSTALRGRIGDARDTRDCD